jgi:hypothetical protein
MAAEYALFLDKVILLLYKWGNLALCVLLTS